MSDLTLTAAAYLAALIAACVALSWLLKAVTSPEAVELLNDIAVRLAE